MPARFPNTAARPTGRGTDVNVKELAFVAICVAYLLATAWAVISSHRRRLGGGVRLMVALIAVLLVPIMLFLALLATGDAFLIAGWGFMLLLMLGGGALLALITTLKLRPRR